MVEPAWRASFVGWRGQLKQPSPDPTLGLRLTSNWSRIPPGGTDSSYNPLPTAVPATSSRVGSATRAPHHDELAVPQGDDLQLGLPPAVSRQFRQGDLPVAAPGQLKLALAGLPGGGLTAFILPVNRALVDGLRRGRADAETRSEHHGGDKGLDARPGGLCPAAVPRPQRFAACARLFWAMFRAKPILRPGWSTGIERSPDAPRCTAGSGSALRPQMKTTTSSSIRVKARRDAWEIGGAGHEKTAHASEFDTPPSSTISGSPRARSCHQQSRRLGGSAGASPTRDREDPI